MKIYIQDKVNRNDSRDNFLEMQSWAQDNCKSFVYMNILHTTDLSHHHDYVGEFKFTDERDATLFVLRWT